VIYSEKKARVLTRLTGLSAHWLGFQEHIAENTQRVPQGGLADEVTFICLFLEMKKKNAVSTISRNRRTDRAAAG
jgi:hypothetical protein